MTTLLTPPTMQLPADPGALALPPPEEHDRWLEMRRTGFGGSDAAAAIGLNRYSSPYKLFCEKLGLVPDFVGNERTRWGKLLEDVVANEAARRLGADTVLVPTAMYRSKTWPSMRIGPLRSYQFSTPGQQSLPAGQRRVLSEQSTEVGSIQRALLDPLVLGPGAPPVDGRRRPRGEA